MATMNNTNNTAGAATSQATKAAKETHHDLSNKGVMPGVDEDLLKPLWIATQITRRPVMFCCCIFWFVILLTVIDSFFFEFTEEDERTWFVEDSSVVKHYDAYLLAKEALSDSGDEGKDPQTQQDADWTMFFMFELNEYSKSEFGDNSDYWILTPDRLETIIKYEDMVVKDKEWLHSFCYVIDTDTYQCQYTSIAREIVEAFDYQYQNMTTEAIKSWLWEYYETSESQGTVESLFNPEYPRTNQTYLYRSFYLSALPITTNRFNVTINETFGNDTYRYIETVHESKYDNDNDKYDDQEEDYDDWVDDIWTDITVDHDGKLKENGLRIVFIEWTIYNEEFNVLLQEAMVWVIAAILAVLFWVTVHLRSLFLSCLALIEIVLSFPFAYIIYRGVLQIEHFDTLSTLIIFVLLGVGADDVFVFTDAWRQSLHFVSDKKDLYQRMAFAYRRAAKAMLVTQTTTFFAFLATSFSLIMPISAFGIWAGCIVVCNYILVITMYPALLLVHHKYVRPCESKYCCCCCPEDPNDPENENKKQTNKRPASTRKKSYPGTNTPKNKDENIELTTKSAIDGKHVSPHSDGSESDDDEDGVPPPMARRQSTVAEQSIEYDCLERFFAVKWATFVIKTRFVILVAFAVLFGVAVWRASELEGQNEEEVWFPDEHYMKRALDLQGDFGASEESGLVFVNILFGVESVDREGTDSFDPEDYGKIVWDKSFDLSSYKAQEYFHNACNELKETSLVFQATSVTCPLNYFIEYLNATTDGNYSFPWTYTDRNDSNFDDSIQFDKFAEIMYNFSESDYAFDLRADSLLFVDMVDDKPFLRYIMISAYADSKVDDDLDVSQDALDDWEDWVDDMFNKNDDCPKGINLAKESSFRWCWMRTNEEFRNSAFQGIAIALPLAFLVLLVSTQNWIVAIFATLDIVGVMSCELGIMDLMGWEFGVSESVAIVIVIGFSVDYVVHLANAYLETENDDRNERLSFALLTMGISVVSGAVTTFLAGLFLLAPDIIFFVKMGVLIVTTILFSLGWSMLFFIAVLATCGPQGDTGNIPFEKLYICCKKDDDDDDDV